ncbi:MAG: hypothetical protein AB7E05_04090 [Sphingobium sp.]
MRRAWLLLAGLAAACGPQGQQKAGEGGATAAVAGNSAANASLAANPLERAAIKAGIVADIHRLPPVGLYRLRHEAGRDSLCILPAGEGVPAGEGGGEDRLRFGLEASFGENVECHGQGMARASGDKLILNFDRSSCLVVAQYEGDRIALPGTLDKACRKLCSERGSLEGTSFPRVSREASVAAAALGRDGARLCPSTGN